METEKSKGFIEHISDNVFHRNEKMASGSGRSIQQHDTVGMTVLFKQISKRLRSLLVFVNLPYCDGSNILIVTHAFLIKT